MTRNEIRQAMDNAYLDGYNAAISLGPNNLNDKDRDMTNPFQGANVGSTFAERSMLFIKSVAWTEGFNDYVEYVGFQKQLFSMPVEQ